MIISRDKYWEFDFGTNRWIATGYLRDRWAAMPGLDAGWAQPIGGEANASWVVSQPMGTCAANYGCGHLAHDVARADRNSVGRQISAAAQGKIVTVLPTCGSYFNVIVIEHMVPDIDDTHAPIYSFYGHLRTDREVVPDGLTEGQWVPRGHILGVLADPSRLPKPFPAHVHFEVKNWAALINRPFSNCTNATRGHYISAGYTGSEFVNPPEYFDLAPVSGTTPLRYYNPTRFAERRGGRALAVAGKDEISSHPPTGLAADAALPEDAVEVESGKGA